MEYDQNHKFEFDLSMSELLTYSTVKLNVSLLEKEQIGTGFLVKANESCIYLVTCTHVIDKFIKISMNFCRKKSDGYPDNQNSYPVIIDNINNDNDNWIRDANHDVCIIDLNNVFKNPYDIDKIYFYAIDMGYIPIYESFTKLSAAETVEMIGYPRNIEDKYNNKPIIRKGITSTHIKNDYNKEGSCQFLLDINCYTGSSGSPIFILDEGIFVKERIACAGTRLQLVGLLSQGFQYKSKEDFIIDNLTMKEDGFSFPVNLGIAIRSGTIAKLICEDLKNKYSKI